VTNLQTNQN